MTLLMHRRYPRLTLLVAVTTLLGALSLPAHAAARSYSVVACDAAPGGANRSWVASTNNRSMRTHVNCPSRDEPTRGIRIGTGAGQTVVPYATQAEFRFTAPAGTSIERLLFNAHFARRAAGWRVGIDSSRGFFAGCPAGNAPCATNGGRRSATPGLDRARWVRVVAVCLLTRGCATRAGRQSAVEARLTYAQVTVRDDAVPDYRQVGGPALRAGWHRGSEWLTFQAFDASGVRFVSATANGHRIDSVDARRCDFTRPRPCSDITAGAYLLRTAAPPFVEGRNVVQVASADAAGNVAQFSRTVYVDNHPPGQVRDLIVYGGEGWRSTNSFTLLWRNPGGQTAPLVAARYRLCRVGGACEPERRVARRDIYYLGGISVPSVGDWTLRLYLEDEAGNSSSETLSAPVHLRFDNVAPGRAAPAERNGWLNAAEAASHPEAVRLQFEQTRPLSGVAGYSVSLDGSDPDGSIDVSGEPGYLKLDAVGEGRYRLRARAVSGAGVPSYLIGETEIRIDRSKPDVRASNAPDAAPWQRQPVAVRFLGTDQPNLSGMGGAPQADPVIEDGAYVTYRVDGGPPQRTRGAQAVASVADDGPHVVTYQATDAAGNDSVERSVAFKIDRTPPEAAFEFPDPNDPRHVVARLNDRASGPAGGEIQFRRLGSDDWTILRTRFEGSQLSADLPDERLADGTYELRALARDVAGNQGVGYRRSDGSAARLELPLRLATRVEAAFPGRVVRHCARVGRHRQRCRRVRTRPTSAAHVSFGHSAVVQGRLVTAEGRRSVGGQPLRVIQRVRGGGTYASSTVYTSGSGSFRYTLRGGPSRAVEFQYAGTRATKPSTTAVAFGVAASTSLRIDRSHVLNGDSVLFSGRLAGRVPRSGKLITLQAYVPGRRRWITFATPRSDGTGLWTHSYRFQSTTGVVRYRFRAVVPREGGYPYEQGASRTLSVVVTGR